MPELELDDARWDFDRNAMRFPARLDDGTRIDVLVSQEALNDLAGLEDTAENARRTFDANHDVVETAAEGRIKRGDFNAPGEIIVGIADLQHAAR